MGTSPATGTSNSLFGPVLVLLLGVLLTLFLYRQVQYDGQISLQRRLNSEAQKQAAIIQARINANIQIVDSVRRLFIASQDVTQQEFQAFVEPALRDNPQLQALEWIPRISHVAREEFEATAVAAGLNSFQITERSASGTQRAPPRPEYYPIRYTVPLAGNEDALGFDVASQSFLAPLLEMTRDSGDMSISESFTPVQETDSHRALGIYVPIYSNGVPQMTAAQRREALRGYVVGLFRIGGLVDHLLQDLTGEDLDFELYDATQPRIRLYPNPELSTQATGIVVQGLQLQLPLQGPGLNWMLQVSATPGFLERYRSYTSLILLTVGLLFSVISSFYLFSLSRRRTAILQLADELSASNRELKITGKRLGKLIESAPMAIMSVDKEGNLTGWNPAAESIFGWHSEEVLGRFPPHMEASDSDAEYYRSVKQGETVRDFEGMRRHKDGSEIYVRASGAPLLDDNGEISGAIALIEDRSDYHRAQKSVAARDAILAALHTVARLLLHTNDYASVMPEVLQALGEANHIDRAYLFRNHTSEDGRLLTSQQFEWCNHGIDPQIDNPELQNIPYAAVGLTRWITLLQAGEVIHSDIDDLPTTEQALLKSQGIKTLLVVPIRIDDAWWGLVGFDSCLRHNWEAGHIRLLQVAADNIGAAIRKQDYEQHLRQAAMVFDNTVESVFITDAGGVILDVNRAFTDITGYGHAEAVGRKPNIIKSDRHDLNFYRSMWAVLQQDGLWRGEIWDRRKNGEIFPGRLTVSAVSAPDGSTSHYVGILSDLTALRSSEDRLEYLTHHDPLTDLPNRRLCQFQMQEAIRRASRSGLRMALLLLDLDHFKDVNNSLGHLAGDELLKLFTARLLEQLQGNAYVARIGGDEFVVLLEDLSKMEQAAEVAQKLVLCSHLTFNVNGHELLSNVSIGISLYPENGTDAEVLLRNADAAMHRAKKLGRARYQFYTEDLTDRAYERMSLLAQMQRGIDEEQFHLYYQPQIDLHTGEIIGAEALVRWEHPDMGMISPANFIPLAEESGLIIPLGEWVLRTACKQALSWCAGDSAFRCIAVNVAGPQINPDFIGTVQNVLAETGLAPSCLELEVTEGFIMGRADDAIELLTKLKELGVELAIDDFGTGYSSLSYLKRLPIDKLKIDQSFVRGIPNPDDEAIACAVIALGKSLELKVIAEGIETTQQRDFLLAQYCDEGQGYLYSKPVPVDEFIALLRPKSK